MPLINELQKIGLSDKEAKVYLATLELGQDSVQNIAKKAGVNRATTYVVLKSLIDKGLCSTYDQGKKTYFIASSPSSLESIFELQKKEIEEKKKNLEKLLPNLNSIYNREEGKPVIRYFEGRTGIVNSVSEFYENSSSGGEVRMAYNKDKLKALFPDAERKKYKSIRLNQNIKSKALYNFSEGTIPNTPDGTRIKISEKDSPLTCDLAIYGDNVRISSLSSKPSSVLIKNKDIAHTLKTIFDLAWERAEEKDQKE